ncbi:ceramidase domain-containing protein [Marinobacterium rhizophilum]|uniref:Ceramidase domain-containing protein n=1 Tax=Marinobacterium rhizophilum TaxID=420402 RepID=A0ABY5HLL7_9GAMM|nr:ceramidase domain-containing protein [Marinobacterium rhizophilum]UTW12697.1 ceramidase domain-containing protein [Marinobacterium rhizophilum]
MIMSNVDLYCERLGAGLLAEPVNLATNVAFLIAGYVLWRQAGRAGVLTTDNVLLISLVMGIGVGSGLFHSFATSWARVLDVIPILLFQLAFAWLYARHGLGWSQVGACVLAAAILATALMGRGFAHILNGSLPYAPALLVLAISGLHRCLSRHPVRWLLLVATCVFLVALGFRTIDQAVCPQLRLGTHFLWHVCNAFVLYLCTRTLIDIRKPVTLIK